MSRYTPFLSHAWLAAATALSACALTSCQMPPKGEEPFTNRKQIAAPVDASCGSVYDASSATIRSSGDIIRIQMAWQDSDISRRYFDDELEAGALTQKQAEIIVQAHCADGIIGRTFDNSGPQAALQLALQLKR